MKKRLKLFMLTAVFVFLQINSVFAVVSAEPAEQKINPETAIQEAIKSDVSLSGSLGENVTWVLYKNDTLVISGTGEMEDSEFRDSPWGDYKRVFESDDFIYDVGNSHEEFEPKKIETVIIEEGVTSIGARMFKSINWLSSVYIPKSVVRIGSNAFDGCDKLSGIVIPEGVEHIGRDAFRGCTALTEVTIPETVKNMEGLFFRCENLKKVSLPSNLTSIPDSMFSDCTSLAEIVIPESVTSIEENAFWNCKSLTELPIPAGVTHIGGGAFYGCNFSKLVLPAGIDTIPESLLSSAGNITEIVIPNGVTKIEDYAFNLCSSLSSISIPSTVKYIGKGAFSGCLALENVYYSGSKGNWLNIQMLANNELLDKANILYNQKIEEPSKNNPPLMGKSADPEDAAPIVSKPSAPSVRVDDRAIAFADQGPVLLEQEARVLVPARGVFEAMGAKVKWDQDKQTVTVDSYNNIIRLVLRIDDPVMDVYTFTSLTHADKAQLELDAKPQLLNERTMIPLRAVSETLEAGVDWNADKRLVDITTAQYQKFVQKQEETASQPYDAKTALPNLYLTADKDTVKAGDTVTVSVCVRNAAAAGEGIDFNGLTATIFYNAEQFTCGAYTPVIGGQDASATIGGSNPAFKNDSVKFTFIMDPTQSYPFADGVISKIQFKAKADGPAVFTLSDRITDLGDDTMLLVSKDKKSMGLASADELFIDTAPLELK